MLNFIFFYWITSSWFYISIIFPRVIIHRGVAKKNSKSSTMSSRSSNINGISSIVQSTDPKTNSSANVSLDVSQSSPQTFNANMPRPPPSTLQALVPLSVASHVNEYVDPGGESEDDNAKDQQQFESRSEKINHVDHVDDENGYTVNLLHSKRQSLRIQNLKRTYTKVSVDLTAKRKKK